MLLSMSTAPRESSLFNAPYSLSSMKIRPPASSTSRHKSRSISPRRSPAPSARTMTRKAIGIRFRQFLPRLPHEDARINPGSVAHRLAGEKLDARKRQGFWKAKRLQELHDFRRKQTPRLPNDGVGRNSRRPCLPRVTSGPCHKRKPPCLDCFRCEDGERLCLNRLPRRPLGRDLRLARRPRLENVARDPPQVG